MRTTYAADFSCVAAFVIAINLQRYEIKRALANRYQFLSSPGVSLAESKCQNFRSGRYGPPTEDQRGRHHRESQKEIYGRLYICILFSLRNINRRD